MDGLDVRSTVLDRRQELWGRLTHDDFDLVVLAPPTLPADPDALIASICALPERPGVIALRPTEDAEERARLLAAGCLAVLWKGLSDQALRRALAALVERRRDEARQRHRQSRPEDSSTLGDFAYASPAMQAFMRVAHRVVPTESTILILGETGVGKEWLARAIHHDGPRASGPFIAVNCGALPEHLLESELFGHEEGAFTGATRSRKGFFELAHQGTIFLDEIGEMPTHLQVKLLHALERRHVVRVGGERPVRVDVRIMAATNRNLEEEIAAGRFRLDLYYRLAVMTLTLPPLRDRALDVPALVDNYVAQFATALRKPVTGVVPEAMRALAAYRWPGNVRELINVIERAVLLCQDTAIGLADLPHQIVGAPSDMSARTANLARASVETQQGFRDARQRVLDQFEREYLTTLLLEARGRLADAAQRSGLNARTLYDLMRKHDLRKEAFKVNRVAQPEPGAPV
jgi:two-component system response regulator AtoC